ncbi:hypothetical protein DFH09DRAFT_1331060 [Mycena vulgaris]|nr:hypothetical protein DFH09DRAFT_1331060 [Mycena vulgaris]
MAPAAKSSKVKEMFKPYNEADVPDIMPFPDLATVATSNGEHIAVPKLNQHQRSYILDVALRNADLGDLGTQKEANEFYDQVKTQALDAKAFQHKVQPGDRAEEASLSERINTWKLENPSLPNQGWTLGFFLYNIFRTRDIKGNEIHRSSTHSQMVSIFLTGRAKKSVAKIITEWMAHPVGRIPAHSPNLDLMYSTTVPYSDIKPVRAALTAFSTQTIGKKVGDEAENAVKLSSGLHVSIGKKHPETKLRREDLGRVPSLTFNQANLLPLMRGILYFGSSAPVELMNYNSRIGNMPAPATIRCALISLSTEEARATQLPMARKLYRAYGTARGRDHAMYDTGTESKWAQTVPRGSSWVPSEIEHSSLDTKKRKAKKKTAEQQAKKPRKSNAKPAPKPCTGDFVFAQNVDFIRDGMNSRKLTTAVARGDISRIYECIKYLLFTFGGSTHTNYLNYILETIMNLELECSPGLKVALLRGLIWNLSGITSHCEEGDFIVEFFNRLLEDVVEHKSAQFDDIFIRDIISRNLRHIAQLKVAWRTGLGMEKKSHKHADPHTKPEMRTLLKLYKDTELHSQRLGRQIDDRDTDDFARGVEKLREGALQASIGKTISNQQVFRTDTVTPPTGTDVANHADDAADDNEGPLELSEEESESSSDNSDSDLAESKLDEDSSMDNIYATRGATFLVDGELVFDERDMLVGPEDVLDSESEEQEPGDN